MKFCLHKRFFKEHSISILIISSLIHFALVALYLLMLKVCGIIGMSEIELFIFFLFWKDLKKILKTIENLPGLECNHFSQNFNKIQTYFWFFTENLTLSFLVLCWASNNTDLHSNSNISKKWHWILSSNTFFYEYWLSFLMISGLMGLTLVVLYLLMFKIYRIIGISKIESFNFFGTESVNVFYFETGAKNRNMLLFS